MQEIRMNNNVTKVMDISNAVFTAFWGEHWLQHDVRKGMLVASLFARLHKMVNRCVAAG